VSPPAASDAAASLLAGVDEALPDGRLAEQLAIGRRLRVKLGIDPTAPDIHLGHTVVLRELRAFQELGHTVVLIVGDWTARIGDPSGQSAVRPVLTAAEIAANAATYQEQVFKLLDRERTEVRHNSEWLDMPMERLFELVGKITLARLIERDDFRQRMAAGRPISALELLYPVLQGYDSVAVESDVEIGGTDQKFNLLFARDVQQAFGHEPQSIITMPILPGTDGEQRMSKSLGNYIGVNEPPEEMFGKTMSIPDGAMDSYYRLLLGQEPPSGTHPAAAKRALARRLVETYWDERAAERAETAFDRIHVEHEFPEAIEEAEVRTTDGLVHVPAVLEEVFGLSRSEGRRLLAQGGVKLDGEVLGADRLDLEASALEGKVLQVGRRRFARLHVAS
jgi:tyrosyl-tRNA synthetase